MKRHVNILLLMVVAACAVSLWQAMTNQPAGRNRPTAKSQTESLQPAPWSEAEPMPPWLTAGKANIHLVILNGTQVAGLARDISLALSLAGCVTQRVGNAPHEDFSHSLLVNRRLDGKQAAQLAKRLGGIPVIEEKDSRTHEDALLVLGADYGTILEALGVPAVTANSTN